MSCSRVHRLLPGYLDGALDGDLHVQVRGHLEACSTCRRELDRYTHLATALARLPHRVPPADLGLRIRVAVSSARASQQRLRRLYERASILVQNILEPVVLPATGGVVTACLMFAIVFHTLFLGIPPRATADDIPISLMQPARLESLAPFPVTTGVEGADGAEHQLLVVEATVNASGQVTDYQILAGPDNEAIHRQVYQVLLFSRFRPQMSFGRPTAGGRVLLQFTEVRVRG